MSERGKEIIVKMGCCFYKIYTADLDKLYYFKKKNTPPLPMFSSMSSEFNIYLKD